MLNEERVREKYDSLVIKMQNLCVNRKQNCKCLIIKFFRSVLRAQNETIWNAFAVIVKRI